MLFVQDLKINEVVFLPFSTFSHLKDKLQVLKKVQLPLGPPRRSPPPSSHHPVSYFDTFFARKLVRLATSNNFCCFFHLPSSISSSPSQRKSCQIKIAAVIKFGSFLALIHKRLSDGFNTILTSLSGHGRNVASSNPCLAFAWGV